MPGTGRWTSDDASLEARLPGPLRQFLELYGASRFWDSHEALEEAWRRNGSDFYQGLILYASFYKQCGSEVGFDLSAGTMSGSPEALRNALICYRDRAKHNLTRGVTQRRSETSSSTSSTSES
jgi:hypothetical protein